MSDSEFRAILQSVPNAYDDFVNGFVKDITDDESRQKMVNFIKNNPTASSGYVIKFYTENIWNEEDDYEDDDMIYDDNGNEIGLYGDLVREGRW